MKETRSAEFGPNCSYVNKLGYLLETPVNPQVLATQVAVTILEVRTISRKDSRSDGRAWMVRCNWENPQRLHAKLRQALKRASWMIQSDLHSDMQETSLRNEVSRTVQHTGRNTNERS